jgi:galactose-1-phosphate uridylyltransferase
VFDTLHPHPHPQLAATPALPPAATRCLRAASRRDHAHAKAVRRSSQANRSRACNRRARHLSVYAASEEANAVDLLRETR